MKLTYWSHSGYEAQGEVAVPVAFLVHNDNGSSSLVVWDSKLDRWQEVDPDMPEITASAPDPDPRRSP